MAVLLAVSEEFIDYSGECMHVDKKTNATGETLSISFLPANSSETQQQWTLKIEFVSKHDNSFEVGSATLVVPFKEELNASGNYLKSFGG